MKRSSLVIGVIAIGLLALAARAAWAHGIADRVRDNSVVEFLPLGREHMQLGWDDLPFLAGVVLLAGGEPRRMRACGGPASSRSRTCG